ncbi:MarR family transcriptional regulator [Coriobacteriales bacterium OH1046]|nr:MarR family transcriptional regulator [Coriobacteriales bacterium OH1046]
MKVSENSNVTDISLARKTAHLGRLIHRYYQADAHEAGMGCDPLRGQGRILALLSAKPETTQRELSYLLDMRQQSLSELLAKLEERGYITRGKSADDGRVTKVSLTEAGAQAAPDLEALSKRTDVLDCLDTDERAQFESLVDKLTDSLAAKLEEKGIDPHAMRRRPHHGHRCPDPDGRNLHCEGPHMMRRGPHFEGEATDPESSCRRGRGGRHGMHRA